MYYVKKYIVLRQRPQNGWLGFPAIGGKAKERKGFSRYLWHRVHRTQFVDNSSQQGFYPAHTLNLHKYPSRPAKSGRSVQRLVGRDGQQGFESRNIKRVIVCAVLDEPSITGKAKRR